MRGSLAGAHTAWVTTTNTTTCSINVEAKSYVFRWSFADAQSEPVFSQTTVSGHYINYNAGTDYISDIISRIMPVDDTDTFYYHTLYYDNLGSVRYASRRVYFPSAPTLCQFVDGGECKILGDFRDAPDGYPTYATVSPPAGVQIINIDGNDLMVYGSLNDSGLSTVTLATIDDASSPSFKNVNNLIELNPTGFSYRLTQAIEAKVVDNKLIVSVGNGGMAVYTIRSTRQISTGIDNTASATDIVSTHYYTPDGLQLSTLPTHGLIIRQDRMADGTLRHQKLLR